MNHCLELRRGLFNTDRILRLEHWRLRVANLLSIRKLISNASFCLTVILGLPKDTEVVMRGEDFPLGKQNDSSEFHHLIDPVLEWGCDIF